MFVSYAIFGLNVLIECVLYKLLDIKRIILYDCNVKEFQLSTVLQAQLFYQAIAYISFEYYMNLYT